MIWLSEAAPDDVAALWLSTQRFLVILSAELAMARAGKRWSMRLKTASGRGVEARLPRGAARRVLPTAIIVAPRFLSLTELDQELPH